MYLYNVIQMLDSHNRILDATLESDTCHVAKIVPRRIALAHDSSIVF